MKRQTKIILGLIVIVVLVSIFAGILQYVRYGIEGYPPAERVMYCKMDLVNKTLTVTKVEKYSYYNWSDIEVTMGNATLPTGFIDVGDIITNCSNEVELVYKPQGTQVGRWPFEE